ncbi:HAD family hydrolase [Alicyclobacillus acidiphilus]|uniref:HAD family hydrolase n=1 Tax=Alicyclobacillus acidiphilus TaxID=182455 RepID=UPI00351DDE4E
MSRVNQLKDCRLFIFDLDGTVYGETEHFQTYADELTRFVPQDKQQQFQQEVMNALAESGRSLYGKVYARDTGEVVAVNDGKQSEAHMHVDDPWGLLQVKAAVYGVPEEARNQAFLATRDWMAAEAFAMRPLVGFREALLRLKAEGRHMVLATNSPEPDSRSILTKLQLIDVFEDFVFRAKKPFETLNHFRRWLDKYDVAPEFAVSVGDHYRNEILPAIQLGMKTVYVDRYIREPRPDVTVQVNHPEELTAVLLGSLKSPL